MEHINAINIKDYSTTHNFKNDKNKPNRFGIRIASKKYETSCYIIWCILNAAGNYGIPDRQFAGSIQTYFLYISYFGCVCVGSCPFS